VATTYTLKKVANSGTVRGSTHLSEPSTVAGNNGTKEPDIFQI